MINIEITREEVQQLTYEMAYLAGRYSRIANDIMLQPDSPERSADVLLYQKRAAFLVDMVKRLRAGWQEVK